MKVIITGATGMVGEGVMLGCLQNPAVTQVLIISRKHYDLEHPKLQELIVADFFQLNHFAASLTGYDACFFCAGISSVGMKEETYTHITYHTTLAFANTLLAVNNNICFCFVSGAQTDSTEKGGSMWARVKGRTENHLASLGFKAAYNFRPGAMVHYPGQKNWKGMYKLIVTIINVFSPKSVLSLQEIGQAMVKVVQQGYPKQILEIPDIRKLATAV